MKTTTSTKAGGRRPPLELDIEGARAMKVTTNVKAGPRIRTS